MLKSMLWVDKRYYHACGCLQQFFVTKNGKVWLLSMCPFVLLIVLETILFVLSITIVGAFLGRYCLDANFYLADSYHYHCPIEEKKAVSIIIIQIPKVVCFVYKKAICLLISYQTQT
jgi:hypothetical protein